MKKKTFWIITFLIILFGFITRIYIVHGNNLYFTVDQGRDAVYVREILNSHAIFTKGPESSVRGLFTGPLWYYFISLGYAIFNGNPFGAIFVLIVLNLTITFGIIYVLKKEANDKLALITGFGLMIFWPFFNTSLYGFNPFPLVSISILLMITLTKLLETNKEIYYFYGLILILLALNTELAGAVAFLIFYICVGAYCVIKKKLNLKKYLLFAFGIPFFGIIKIVIDYLRQPKANVSSGLNVFGGTNFIETAGQFVKIIGSSIIPQNIYLGFLVVVIVTIFYFWGNKKKFVYHEVTSFAYLSLFLIFISYLFFGSNHGWREWHTVYIPVLTFLAVLGMCWEQKTKGKILIAAILILNIFNFKNNYVNYLKPSRDRSLLYNQIKTLDWIYTHNENNGFNLYTYTDSFYDYSYQYLVSWYAKDKYGFYPCEYSNFPLSIKALYIPRDIKYSTPQLGCDKFRFLIIDSVTNGNENKDWINQFKNQTIFVEKTQIGDTTIEKRRLPDKIR